jgi:hypothetical protein
MAMVRVGSIVLRVDDLRRQTAFWSAALDYAPRAGSSADRNGLWPAESRHGFNSSGEVRVGFGPCKAYGNVPHSRHEKAHHYLA